MVRVSGWMKPIAAPAKGLQAKRLFRFGQFPAQIGDMHFNHVGVMFPVEIVKVFEQLLFGDDNAWPMHEVLENAKLRGRKRNGCLALGYGLFQSIQFDVADAKHGVRHAFAATDEGFGARN